MNDQLLEDEAIEQIAKDRFGIDLEIRQMIAKEIPISHTGEASVFLSKKKQLYAYIHGQSNFVLGDIQKIVARMGLKAELYVPPKANLITSMISQPKSFARHIRAARLAQITTCVTTRH